MPTQDSLDSSTLSNSAASTTVSSSSSSTNTSFNQEEIKKQIEEWNNNLNKYICPLSQQQLMNNPIIMSNPVIIETGYTFERTEIEKWFENNNTCPITQQELSFKLLIPNISLKTTLFEAKENYVTKVIKNVKLWLSDLNLINLCSELINKSLKLIENDNHFETKLLDLKFDLLINTINDEQLLLNEFINLIIELNDLNFKIVQLQKLENKLLDEKCLQKYYNELVNLIIENKDNTLLNDIFLKYCKTNKTEDDLIMKVLNYFVEDNLKLSYLIILFDNSSHDRNFIFTNLLNTKISNNNNTSFILFFKKLFMEINLKEFNLLEIVKFIKDYRNDLNEEMIIIYKEIYKNSNDINDLELLYDLNTNDKENETLLLNEYLKLNLLDKYLNLYIKVNENKLDCSNIVLFKLLKIQNNKIENQNQKIENQNNEINNLQQTNTNQNKEISDLKQLNINQNHEINNLQQTINNTNNFINNCLLQNNNLEKELKEWKNQQIINKFKIKYPEYDYVNIINIETPLNVKKYYEFFSDEFEVFGLKWKILFYPKGNSKSNEDECGIYLRLKSLQYKIENEEEKEISSIKIKYSIDSINLNDNRNGERNFTEIYGYGNYDFKQSNFIPIIKNDKQIFSVVIGMKKLDIKFK
ncbi:hypothetical protein ABK040_014634 [Willaertia magna]